MPLQPCRFRQSQHCAVWYPLSLNGDVERVQASPLSHWLWELSIQHHHSSMVKNTCERHNGFAALSLSAYPLSSKPTAGGAWAQSTYCWESASAFPWRTPAWCWTWNEKHCRQKIFWEVTIISSLILKVTYLFFGRRLRILFDWFYFLFMRF